MTRMVLSILISFNLYASPTELGNGNDGEDLIEFQEVTEGIIFDSRKEAVKLLSQINLRGIQGLGYLKDEVEKSQLFIAKDGLSTQQLLDLGAFKSGSNPIVYARTFPRPHAPTRFYPAAKSLSKKQLIAVHIHEGLHRALPEHIRSNEVIVEEITRVITSPNSTFEDIVLVMNHNLPASHGDNSRQLSSLQVPTKQSSFFQTGKLSLVGKAFNQSDIPIWQRAIAITSETNIYTWEDYRLIGALDYYVFQVFNNDYSDNRLAPHLRIEKQKANGENWGVQIEYSNQLNSTIYNNPLTREILTTQVDWNKKYGSLRVSSAFRYTTSSEASGSPQVLKDIVGDARDEFFYNNNDLNYYGSETHYGSIFSLDLEIKKEWSEKSSTFLGISAHKMTDYWTYAGFYNDDFREENASIPILPVLHLGTTYAMGDINLILEYSSLLNSPFVPELGRKVDLTTLGDPVGRGLGRSSLSLSLALNL